jgi:hypothetical protein
MQWVEKITQPTRDDLWDNIQGWWRKMASVLRRFRSGLAEYASLSGFKIDGMD